MGKRHRRSRSSGLLITSLAFLLILLAVYAYASYVPYPFNPFSSGIVPSFEGLNAGVEGFSVDGRFYSIGGSAPTGYKWISDDPRNAVLERDRDFFYSTARVRIEVSQPKEVKDWFTQPQKIHYWVRTGESEFVEVEGEVVAYEIHITVSSLDCEGIDEWFNGERIWIALASLTWDRAYQKWGADYGRAWEAPIAAVITEFKILEAGEHGEIEPSVSGRWFTLYTSPEAGGTIGDLGLSVGADLNASLAGDPSPDTRIRRVAYIPITLSEFGTTDHWGWIDTPVADYTVKVYAIRIGKFTYTNPDNTPWGQRQPHKAWLEIFYDWMVDTLGIPASIIGWGIVGVILFLLFMLAMVVVVAVAVRLGVGVEAPRR